MIARLLRAGTRYVRDMDLADVAAMKFCLASMGILLGLGIPARMKRPVGWMAAILFLGTYIPLMSKFVDHYHQEVQGEDFAPLTSEEETPAP